MTLFLSLVLTASHLFLKKIHLHKCHKNLEKIYEYTEIYLYETSGQFTDLYPTNQPAGHILKEQLLNYFKSPSDQKTIQQIFKCPSDPREKHLIDQYGSYDIRSGIIHKPHQTGLSGKNFFFAHQQPSIIMMGDFRSGWHDSFKKFKKISVIYMNGLVDYIDEKKWQNNLDLEVHSI